MKKKYSHFEYEEERNEDLMRAYREIREKYPEMKSREIDEEISRMPSKRFWVSEERASIVISAMLKGRKFDRMGKTKLEMYNEILKRVIELKQKMPNKTLSELVFNVVNSPAPKFYLTPGSIRILIHKIKTKWYEDKKRKYSY